MWQLWHTYFISTCTGIKILFSINAHNSTVFVYCNCYGYFLCDKNIIEVKNVTLVRNNGLAEFPDAVTSRGLKHLINLTNSIKKGYIPYVLFLTQIQDINSFRIAKDIDKAYYQNYIIAKKAGVKFIAYRCKLNSKEIKIEKKIKITDEK